jgi:hypothetical protein
MNYEERLIRTAQDVDRVRESIRSSPTTARILFRRTGIPYKRVLAALRVLQERGEARWNAHWYGKISGYARVWGLTD